MSEQTLNTDLITTTQERESTRNFWTKSKDLIILCWDCLYYRNEFIKAMLGFAEGAIIGAYGSAFIYKAVTGEYIPFEASLLASIVLAPIGLGIGASATGTSSEK